VVFASYLKARDEGTSGKRLFERLILDIGSEEKFMLTIMVLTMIAVGLASVVLMKSRTIDPAQLVQPRTGLMTIGIQIICGDCAGEEGRPIKTYLDRSGNCAHCGGSSYLLASAVGVNSALLRAGRLREAHIASSHGRVIPFEVPGSRASRSERIAV
jgi:hypothetical protein